MAKQTGPITAEGKQKSSKNALKHGLYSTSMFVRSFQGGRFFPTDTTVKFTQQSAAGWSLEVYGSIEQTVRAFRAGRITSWGDVLSRSRQ